MKITLDKVVAGAEGSLGGRDPGLSGIPAFEGCSLNLSKVKEGVTEVILLLVCLKLNKIIIVQQR